MKLMGKSTQGPFFSHMLSFRWNIKWSQTDFFVCVQGLCKLYWYCSYWPHFFFHFSKEDKSVFWKYLWRKKTPQLSKLSRCWVGNSHGSSWLAFESCRCYKTSCQLLWCAGTCQSLNTPFVNFMCGWLKETCPFTRFKIPGGPIALLKVQYVISVWL